MPGWMMTANGPDASSPAGVRQLILQSEIDPIDPGWPGASLLESLLGRGDPFGARVQMMELRM